MTGRYAALLLGALPLHAQTTTPQPPVADAGPTLRVNARNVLVPTLVEKQTGEVVYGLTADNFVLLDNGTPQKLHLDDDLDTTPVSLVLCLEKGRSSAMQFERFSRLTPLIEQFLGAGHGEIALVEFDSKATYQEGWTHDTSVIENDLQALEPGDGGAAILDAAGLSIDLLEQRPSDRRRILLMITESRDHGSKEVDEKQLVEKIGASNTLVLSLTWSPAKAEILDQLAHGGGNLIEFFPMLVNAVRANVARSLAVMSGGEYLSFGNTKSFEDRVMEMASHARNRYLLSFRPSDATPGLHTLQVTLRGNVDARVVARTDYWSQP